MAQIKRKVTLRQKNVSNNEVAQTPPTSKKLWWPWVLGFVVVCGGLIFFLTRGNNTTGDDMEQSTNQVTENVTPNGNSTSSFGSAVSDTAESIDGHSSLQEGTPKTDKPQKESEKPIAQQKSLDQLKTSQKSDNLKTTAQNNSNTPNSISSSTAIGTVEEEAWRTIRGNYGNGRVRREALGSRYDEIQAKVNEFYREGSVH